MKKILIFFILISNIFANYDNYELKLYEKILPAIFTNKLLIFIDNSNTDILKDSDVLETTLDCEKANLLIGKNFTKLSKNCQNKPIFSTSYRSFKDTPNSIGAFYWRKGRPQIKFKLDVIDEFSLHLPKSLMEFAK